jgi:hypothetical protein
MWEKNHQTNIIDLDASSINDSSHIDFEHCLDAALNLRRGGDKF